MSLTGVQHLLDVMERLRNPNHGCPWDLEQNFQTIAPHTLEETYELIEAIEQDDIAHIKEELGDVLFQTVFYAQIAKDDGLFSFDEVAQAVADKMIERHPHVFGDRNATTATDVLVNWEADKAAKRAAAANSAERASSVLDGVSTALPAATHAVKLQKRAARVGFDWTDPHDVIAKIHEEIGELQHEMKQNPSGQNDPKAQDAIEDEMGDVLFAVVNLARKLDVDPETALRRTNRKFERRFRAIETQLSAQGRAIADASLDEMEKLWVAIKQAEKRSHF